MMVKDKVDVNVELYNNDVKAKFLRTIENPGTRLIYEYALRNSKQYEEFMQKDIAKMNLEELSELLYSLKPTTLNAAYHNYIRIKHYVDWAIKNGHGHKNSDISPFAVVMDTMEFNQKFVARYMTSYLTRKDILELIGTLYNKVDRALLLSLFEGISGMGYKEILNLKRSDINKELRMVKLFDGETKRFIMVSETLIELLLEADSESEYYSRNGEVEDVKQRHISDYEESGNIFKRTQKGNKRAEGLDTFYIQRKFAFFKKQFNMEYMKPRSIINSGILFMAHELYQEQGRMSRDELLEIAEKYNTPFSSNGERNLAPLKRILKDEEFETLYGYKLPL